jgi:hypothetical protein
MIDGILNMTNHHINVTVSKLNKIIFQEEFNYPYTRINIDIDPIYIRQGSHFMKLQSNRIIDNPCYLRGYNNKTIVGTGNFRECYEKLEREFNVIKIDLYEIFNKITDIIDIEGYTYSTVKERIRFKCETEYSIDVDYDLCETLTIFILAIDKVKVDSGKSPFHSFKEYQIIATFSEYNQQSEILIYTIILFSLYVFSYIYKNEILEYIKNKFSKENMEIEDIYNNKHSNMIESVIRTLPIKNFLFIKYKKQIKSYFKRDTSYSLIDFVAFFYELLNTNTELLEKINSILKIKVSIEVNITISTIQIIICFFLSILTNKTITYLDTFSNILFLLFSFLYMTVASLETVNLVKYYNDRKYYNSDIISFDDREFVIDNYEYINI